uniref:Uncharacterized protein n=1 Tax=Trypanosoma congolense (strain IL3000) TaxID=1068625 RepID=G0US16_TRYCI|nr:hypothetical protein TCIL3000_8_3990 [Trypanosoma congolense IL3000]
MRKEGLNIQKNYILRNKRKQKEKKDECEHRRADRKRRHQVVNNFRNTFVFPTQHIIKCVVKYVYGGKGKEKRNEEDKVYKKVEKSRCNNMLFKNKMDMEHLLLRMRGFVQALMLISTFPSTPRATLPFTYRSSATTTPFNRLSGFLFIHTPK